MMEGLLTLEWWQLSYLFDVKRKVKSHKACHVPLEEQTILGTKAALNFTTEEACNCRY